MFSCIVHHYSTSICIDNKSCFIKTVVYASFYLTFTSFRLPQDFLYIKQESGLLTKSLLTKRFSYKKSSYKKSPYKKISLQKVSLQNITQILFCSLHFCTWDFYLFSVHEVYFEVHVKTTKYYACSTDGYHVCSTE